MIPQILCIGHVCHDRTDRGFVLGGTASYCSIVAAKLGYKTALLTSFGPDFLFGQVLRDQGVEVINCPSEKTTVFKNIYREGTRIQYLQARANQLGTADVPRDLRKVEIVKFCLIADEIDPGVLLAFPNALKGATIQGWLRQWDKDGLVCPKAMDWSILQSVNVICMSKDDILGYEDKIPMIISLVEVVVITDGRHGATVYHNSNYYSFPSFPIEEVDPTGAGDVFAAAFLLRYAKTRNINQASIFAHCAASIVVEGVGIEPLSDLNLIESRMESYLRHFPEFKESI